MQTTKDADVQPFDYQVGGHCKADGKPASLRDSQGRFLKKLQAGERGDREVAFYAAIEQHRQAHADEAAPDGVASNPGQAAAARTPNGAGPAASVMQQLAQWVPRSFGVRHVGGAPYLVLADLTAQYAQPSVLDIKMGFHTWYAWASDSQQQKYRAKDVSTTQASLGFRVCGLRVASAAGEQAWRADKQWGKQLTPDTVGQAFTRFADNGCLCLSDLLLGPGMLLEQLQRLADLAAHQDCWHMFSSSLLVVYEGSARTALEARLAVRLIDFAHTFPTAKAVQQLQLQQQQQQQPQASTKQEAIVNVVGPCGVDENFAAGLCGLIRVLHQTLDQQQPQQQ